MASRQLRRPFLLLALAAALGCQRVPPPTGDRASTVPSVEATNALDTLKLCRFSDEEGPVHFTHRLHADLRALDDGLFISCDRCHHDMKTHGARIPRSCSSCHVQHGGPNPTGIQTL